MHALIFYKNLTALFLIFFANNFFCQTNNVITLSLANEECSKGAAGIQIAGLLPSDAVGIYWSNDVYNVNAVNLVYYSPQYQPAILYSNTIEYNIY